MMIPYPIEALDYILTNQIHNIKVANFCFPVLIYDWDLKLFNKLSGHSFPMPLQIPLTWIQSFKLRIHLKSKFFVQLMYASNHPLIEFNFLNSIPNELPIIEQGITEPVLVHNPTVDASIRSLYPTL